MRSQRILLGLAVVMAIAVAVTTKAQSIRDPRIIADIPYEVVVGETHLQPGEYEIRGLNLNNPVVQIISQDSLKVEATTMPVFAEAREVPETTQVTLQKVGGNYYLDKIWIQGKLTGFEFPLPDEVRVLQRENAEEFADASDSDSPAIVGRYEPAAVATLEANRPAELEANPPVELEESEERRVEPEPFGLEAVEPEENLGELAQVNPAPQPSAGREAVAPETPAAPAPQQELPATAANWLGLILAGIGSLGAGAALRLRK